MLIHQQYIGFLAWLEGICPAGKAALSLQLEAHVSNSANLHPFVITISTLKIFLLVRYVFPLVPLKSLEAIL